MSARARLGAAVLAVILVVVPIVFGEIDGRTGALIGLAFSGASAIVALCSWTVLTIMNRRFDKLERRLTALAQHKRTKVKQP